MKNIIISLCIQLINVLLLILNRLIFTNYLQIEDYGIYTTLSLYANILVMLGSMGLGHSLSYMVNNNIIDKQNIYSYVIRITCYSTALLTPLGIIFLNIVYPTIPNQFIILILISVPFLLFINLMIYSFLEDGKTIRFFLFNSMHIFLSIGLYILLDKNLIYAFIGWTTGSILTFLLLNIYLARNGYLINFKKVSINNFNYLKYGLKIFTNTIINTLNARLSLFIASIILNFEYVAILSITILIADLFNKIFHTFSLIIMSKKGENTFLKYLIISCTITILGLISLFYLGDYFIDIFFPEEYRSSLTFFWIIVPYVIFNGIYGLYYHLLVKQDKAHLGVIASLLNLITLCLLGILLTYNYGVYGLLASLNISSFIGFIVLVLSSNLFKRRGEQTL